MRGKNPLRFWGAVFALVGGLSLNNNASAEPLTWGVNGVGGAGAWNTSNVNWFNGTTNIKWPDSGDAIFAGASGGTVKANVLTVNSMTFNTPGYLISSGVIVGGASGLTVTTNANAVISAGVNGPNKGYLYKDGPATLSLQGSISVDNLQVNQGELQINGTPIFVNYNLADTSGVTLTVAPVSKFLPIANAFTLNGGGTSGGVVQPDNQARTVTLNLGEGGTFGGVLQDNGAGILALQMSSDFNPEILTNANTYSGLTTIRSGAIALAGNGSALNSPMKILGTGALLLDNSLQVANRISDSLGVTLDRATIQLKGNIATPVNENAGLLSLSGGGTITVQQPGAAATQMTFAGLQRNGFATLSVTGPGVSFAGISTGATGIVAPYIAAGNEWANLDADNRITPWTAYATDINSGSASDHVKISAGGVTSLATATTKASLNLQNGSALSTQELDLAGQALQLTSGGILSSGAGSSFIRNGSLSSIAPEMVVFANNQMSIGATITDRSGGATSLIKSGTSELTLTGANTYSGPTAIMQGTLVVSSDANLGHGSTVIVNGTLKAAGDFVSPKGITGPSSYSGIIDTAGFDVEFAGPVTSRILKQGFGTLTLSNPVVGNIETYWGTLALSHVTSGSVLFYGGTLQAAGTLQSLLVNSFANTPIIDIGGPSAATLTIQSFSGPSSSNLQLNFGVGAAASDFLAFSTQAFFPTNAGGMQFEFRNLGGLVLGIDYPLISFPNSGVAPSPSVFVFAPDMAAQGWAGAFHTTTTGVSVRFSAAPVPEPAWTAAMLLQGGAIAFFARRRLRK